MLNAIVIAIRFIILVFSGHKQVALENAPLRQQLALFRHDVKQPKLLPGPNVLGCSEDDLEGLEVGASGGGRRFARSATAEMFRAF